MALRPTVWRGLPAWQLESERLRVVTTPELGAKITSLLDRDTGHEWLVAMPGRPFRPVRYAAVFVDQDMSGWDEMLPSIKACRYPVDGPYAGAAIPDHGEVWALPWRLVSAADGALALAVEGRALPYRLQRTLALDDAATARLDYALTNTGPHAIAVLWAAHPQFTATAHTRIVLPDHIHTLYNVRDIPAWGAWGLHYDWPRAVNRQGQPVRLDRIASAEAGTCRKLYVPPEVPVAWAALREEDAGHWLRMTWDADQVPYLGIWVDEGFANSVATVALEITDGFHDSLETAWEHRRCVVLAPGETRRWQVRLQVGAGPLPGA